MPGLPHLRAMQAFEAVGRCGSVRRAAEDLGVSSGAISQQVRRIEEHLGVALLERRGRQLELTSWGRVYHAEVSKGFAQLAHAGEALARARNSRGFVISSLTTVTNKWLGPRLFEWTADNPGAPVRLVGTEIEPDLTRDNVDFRLYFDDSPPHGQYAELFTDCILPACAPSLLEGRKLQRPEEVYDYPLLQISWMESFAAHQVPGWAEWAAQCGVAPPPDQGGSALSFALSSSAIRNFASRSLSRISIWCCRASASCRRAWASRASTKATSEFRTMWRRSSSVTFCSFCRSALLVSLKAVASDWRPTSRFISSSW